MEAYLDCVFCILVTILSFEHNRVINGRMLQKVIFNKNIDYRIVRSIEISGKYKILEIFNKTLKQEDADVYKQVKGGRMNENKKAYKDSISVHAGSNMCNRVY